MKVAIYDKNATTKSSVSNADLESNISDKALAQVLQHLQDNMRYSIADTKTRGEVSGGGIKPWKQKGTGRARAGSSRSPIWRGGGVTFGPLSVQNHHSRLPRKMHQIAVQSLLIKGIENNTIKVVDEFQIENAKTSAAAAVLRSFDAKGTVLVVTDVFNDDVYRSFRNIPGVIYITASRLTALDIATKSMILLNKAAFEQLFHGEHTEDVKETSDAKKPKTKELSSK